MDVCRLVCSMYIDVVVDVDVSCIKTSTLHNTRRQRLKCERGQWGLTELVGTGRGNGRCLKSRSQDELLGLCRWAGLSFTWWDERVAKFKVEAQSEVERKVLT